jgi:precorrin-6B methylase 1
MAVKAARVPEIKPETLMKPGSLTVVGTGIQFAGQITLEARAHIKQAEKVLFLVTDPITADWIRDVNPTAESLYPYYQQGKARINSYVEMVERILCEVRKGLRVCAVFYGHPGIFVYPSHEAITQARLEGFSAKMLPGISSEDCLFADLGIDPARTGCQSFEATDFLIHKRKFDTGCSMILWQIGCIGDLTFNLGPYDSRGLHVLTEYLCQYYDAAHPAIIYEAAEYPIFDPTIEHVLLAKLAEAQISPLSTLYIPPQTKASLDYEMLDRLGIDSHLLASTPQNINIPAESKKFFDELK